MLKIGDKVKFINEVGGGRITGFQGKTIAIVENHDGFEIPTLMTQLIKIEDVDTERTINRDYSKKPAPVKQVEKAEGKVKEPEHKPSIISGNDEPKFFIAFYPLDQKNPVGDEIEVYLINDSNFTLLYHFCHFDGEKYKTVDYGELEPNTKNLIQSISPHDLSNLPRFWFRIIPFMKESKTLSNVVVKDISVNTVKFYKEKSFTRTAFFKGHAMIFDLVTNPMKDEIDKLTDSDFKKVINEKDIENRPPEPTITKIKTPETLEVDLHIEQLIDNSNGLSNHEMLQIQMDKFHSEMKDAIEKRVSRIVFIHGVGNGVLKQEIYKKLKSTYAKYYFQDASFHEYGFGATMVILKRN